MSYGTSKPNFGPGYTPGPRQAQAELPELTAAFDLQIGSITQRRGASYGHPYDDFGRAAQIKEAVSSCPDPRIRHVLEMIGVKLARLAQTPNHLDSWIDIAGYARTAVMVLDRQQMTKEEPHDEEAEG